MAWEEDLRPMSSHSTNRYFIPNWGNNKDKDKDYIKGQTQNPNYDTSSIKYRRRPIEVRTASAEDYEAAF